LIYLNTRFSRFLRIEIDQTVALSVQMTDLTPN
jgi:hypothetical protein